MASKKPSQIIVSLERRKKKINMSQEARERARQRLKTDERFTRNTRPGEQNGNPKGLNQYTHPQGHKNISEAVKRYVNDKVPDQFAHLVRACGLDPDKCTFADVIAMKQLILALEGSLMSTQFVQDNAEDKMKGPNGGSGSSGAPPVLAIEVVRPK